MREILRVLFGAGMFDDYFGELSFGTNFDPHFAELPEEERDLQMKKDQQGFCR